MFWEVFVNCQRMVAGENSILPVKRTFKSGSHEGRYFYQQGRSSLFLFGLHTFMYFTVCHCLLMNQGKSVKKINWLKL